jgi:hypothetical protein
MIINEQFLKLVDKMSRAQMKQADAAVVPLALCFDDD